MTRRPRWRWLLYSASLALWWRFEWEWCADLYAWAVLPMWLGWDGEEAPHHNSPEAPF